MYPQDQFDAGFRMPITPNCDDGAPLAISNNSDPNKRYQTYGGVTGTGCMNLDCVCPNCLGDCKCGKGGNGMRRGRGGDSLMMLDPLRVGLCIAILIVLFIVYKRRQ